MKSTTLNRIVFLFIILSLPHCCRAHDWETTQLIRKLGSSNDADRVIARQMLPRKGAKVVPDILPLLGNSDPGIWWTADKVLADIANEVSVPGRAEERQFVAEQLMSLLAPATSNEIKERALRLLPIVVPEGFDLAPIASLLVDPDFKMKARDALQLIGTSQSVQALIGGLLKSDKDFQIAILDSLGKIQQINSVIALREYSGKSDPAVRAAAARGLGQWGHLGDLDHITWVWENRTPETEFDAGNALLLYVDRIAAEGGNTGLAVDLYEKVFDQAKDPELTGAAMVGMAKYGDSRVVAPLFSILDRENADDLIPPFLNALIALRGTGANQAVAGRFEKLPESLRIQVIGILGRKGHPVYLPLLTQLADSTVPEDRAAAFIALADLKLAGGVQVLATKVTSGDSEALSALKGLAASLASAGKANEAGQAYAVILDSAQDNDSRKIALGALSRFPRIESFDSVTASLGNPEIKSDALKALSSITRALVQANQKDRANQGFELLLENARSTEDLKTLATLAQELGRSTEILPRSGFLIRWNLIGPFPWKAQEGFSVEHIGEPAADLSRRIAEAGQEYSWKEFSHPDSFGQMNLVEAFGARENVCVYATTSFEMDEISEATLRIGSDDWVKVWLNGEPVHEFSSFRGVTLDQDQIPVTLKKGSNTLLLRINQGVLGYGFVVRLTDREGKPIEVH